MGGLDSRRLVFVDEMGIHTSLAPVYAYAPIGEWAFFEIPRNRGRNTALLSSLHAGGTGPSMTVEGATTGEVFEAYVEHLLVGTLSPAGPLWRTPDSHRSFQTCCPTILPFSRNKRSM